MFEYQILDIPDDLIIDILSHQYIKLLINKLFVDWKKRFKEL